jgi:hypothetical protein
LHTRRHFGERIDHRPDEPARLIALGPKPHRLVAANAVEMVERSAP